MWMWFGRHRKFSLFYSVRNVRESWISQLIDTLKQEKRFHYTLYHWFWGKLNYFFGCCCCCCCCSAHALSAFIDCMHRKIVNRQGERSISLWLWMFAYYFKFFFPLSLAWAAVFNAILFGWCLTCVCVCVYHQSYKYTSDFIEKRCEKWHTLMKFHDSKNENPIMQLSNYSTHQRYAQ